MKTLSAKILSSAKENIREAAKLLRDGEVVAMPTETVYGLAGNAFDERALTKIFSVKERPTFDPLIVHVPQSLTHSKSILQALAEQELVELSNLTLEAATRAEKLMQLFWPGPLTIVLPKTKKVPDLVTSGLATIGLRMPRHPVAQALLEAAGFPLAAPSANRFGRISPTRPEHVAAELGDRIRMILDGGPCEIGVESTVVRVNSGGDVALLRPGAVSQLELEQALGGHVAYTPVGSSAGAGAGAGLRLISPGNLESHYAPNKPFHLLPSPLRLLTREQLTPLLERLPQGSTLGLLVFKGEPRHAAEQFARLTGHPAIARSLSHGGALDEAARALFSGMRELDASEAETLFAEPCTVSTGLGHAISDRLRRASAKSPQLATSVLNG